MRTRDPESKRQQLLDAALSEFAAHGVAGARVDRIAKLAGVSAGLVYSFYEGKAGLFEAVFDAIVEQTVAQIPIDTKDLAEYAGRLFDAGQNYPEVTRFMTWYQLERGPDAQLRATVSAAMKDKVAAIRSAQRRGEVADRLGAAQLVALILTIANMWQRQGEDISSLVPAGKRRATIVDAVRLLVTP